MMSNQLTEQAGWVYQIAQLLNLWEIRAAVFSSFVAHLVLILLARVRRRRAYSARMLILWVAYQFSSWVASYALSNLSICGNTSRRQQLVAFWAMFLLHHLGGPDNISAFSLDDNKLSRREALNVGSRIASYSYVLYKHVYLGSGEAALICASFIIFAVGAAKYAERALALWLADLGKIRSSIKKRQDTIFFTARAGSDCRMKDEEALMVAHQMLPFCKRAMADSSFDMGSPTGDHDLERNRKIFTWRWENMCNVVEMELSLMYDILYTKAAVVHTSVGYGIRVASPLAICAATVLFGFYYSKEGQSIPDVVITYVLLLATLLLDTRWLLRALGSTWTHAFLQASCQRRWPYHAVLCSGRWRRLRHFVVSLDLGRLRLTAPPRSPSSYRRWSGNVGKYNLLHECNLEISACGTVGKKIGLEGVWNKYQHFKGRKLSQDVKRLVFTRVSEVLRSTYEKGKTDRYTMKDITTSWGQVTVKRRQEKLKRFRLAFGREFQEDILVWHIATQVFLIRSRCNKSLISHDKNAATRAKAIKAMSKYLMFLVAMRQSMLPGLPLRNLFEGTFKYLQQGVDTASSCSSSTTRKEKLAEILVKSKEKNLKLGFGHDKSSIVYDGAELAIRLLRVKESEMPELLELIFNVWVDKLMYAATRCSPESHARQLGRGGELTTIVWLMAQHAGPFLIGEDGPDNATDDGDDGGGDEDGDDDGGDDGGDDDDDGDDDAGGDDGGDDDREMAPIPVYLPLPWPPYGGPAYLPQPSPAPLAPPLAPKPKPPKPEPKPKPPKPEPKAKPPKREPKPKPDPKPKPRRDRRRRYATLYPVD